MCRCLKKNILMLFRARYLFMDDPMWENDGCKTKPAISPNLLGGQALFTQALHPNAFAHIPGIDAQNIGDDKLAVMYKMQLTGQWSRWV